MFDYNSKIMSTLLSVTDAVVLGILWLVCCIPVITAGAASTAFYYAYNKSICRKMGYAWREFFRSFKSNFKQATKIWLIVLGLGAVMLADGYLLLVYGEVLPAAGVFMGITLVLTVVLVMWGCVLFPYIARFEAGLKQSLKNAAIIMLANLFLGDLAGDPLWRCHRSVFKNSFCGHNCADGIYVLCQSDPGRCVQ